MLAICMDIASILHLLDLWTEHPADEDLAFERVDEDPADHDWRQRVLCIHVCRRS